MFQAAAADPAALQQQYYPWYQQTQQPYTGYAYPYNYYYPMGPVSIEILNLSDQFGYCKAKTVMFLILQMTWIKTYNLIPFHFFSFISMVDLFRKISTTFQQDITPQPQPLMGRYV